MASKLPKHVCQWEPVSFLEEDEWGPDYAGAKAEGVKFPKPRGYQPAKRGEPVLWACQAKFQVREKDGNRDIWRTHYCINTLTHPEMQRLQNSAKTKAQSAPPKKAQTPPPTSAADKLRAAREAATARNV